MARTKTQMPAPLAQEAARLRARRLLDDLAEMRLVADSVAQGVSQETVAEALRTSQASVSRMLARLTENPRVVRPSVNEVVARAIVNEISREEMLERLRNLRISFVKPERRPDSDWAALARAVRDGAVAHNEARAVAADVALRFVGRVSHAMVLEGQAAPDEATQALVEETTETMLATL